MGYYVVDGRRGRRMPSPRLVSAGRSAIRSAALRLSVASLTRDSLQRTAVWSRVPMAILLAAAVPFLAGGPIAYTAPAVVTGAVVGVVTLTVAAVSRPFRCWLTEAARLGDAKDKHIEN
jgi:hypothetical protein